jgi:PBP1b-binding outer membrane lipoprotein LpoB
MRNFALLAALVLSGCAASVKTVEVYDPKCQITTKKIVASLEQVRALDACSNEQCVAQVLEIAASSVVAPIVVGSVAVVGNVVHWLEKSANCRHAPKEPK